MLTDREIYNKLDAMLPSEVDREGGEHELFHCEYESAIACLLIAAANANQLTDEIISFAGSEYPHGVVALTLGSLVDEMSQSAA